MFELSPSTAIDDTLPLNVEDCLVGLFKATFFKAIKEYKISNKR